MLIVHVYYEMDKKRFTFDVCVTSWRVGRLQGQPRIGKCTLRFKISCSHYTLNCPTTMIFHMKLKIYVWVGQEIERYNQSHNLKH